MMLGSLGLFSIVAEWLPGRRDVSWWASPDAANPDR
jgi:hypothetical protein